MYFSSLPVGDLKLVERPGSVTIGPHDFVNIKASIKVSSTENGIIFGNIGMICTTNHSWPISNN